MPSSLRIGSYVRVVNPHSEYYEAEGPIERHIPHRSFRWGVRLDVNGELTFFAADELMELDENKDQLENDPF